VIFNWQTLVIKNVKKGSKSARNTNLLINVLKKCSTARKNVMANA